MSDKLKIMQEPVVRQPTLGLDEGVNHDEGEQLFYKVETCSMHTYYIRVAACSGSLLAAIKRLMSDFAFDASRYCRHCDSPVVQQITLVSGYDVPVAGDEFVLVSRLQ